MKSIKSLLLLALFPLFAHAQTPITTANLEAEMMDILAPDNWQGLTLPLKPISFTGSFWQIDNIPWYLTDVTLFWMDLGVLAEDEATLRALLQVPSNSEIASSLASYTQTSELADVATSGSYADLTNKPSIPTLSAQASIADAATNAATNAPTTLNTVTTLLGILVGELNATNAKQNDLAAKYNELAGKFNTLLNAQEANGILTP